jgi:uncharacterized DUF497 family protein
MLHGHSSVLTIPEPEHSVGEARYILLGVSSRGRLLVVAHTERGDHLRIVNARLPAPAECRDYEEEQGRQDGLRDAPGV